MEKIFTCIKNIGVWHSFEKMKPQLCFFLKKPFLVNSCISNSYFPDLCKLADVRPVFKKADPLLKKNYRPVSVLSTMSKLFEKLMETQLQDFQNAILHPNV